MWLCTQQGFYSVVHKGSDYHVRARRRRDLENLRELLISKGRSEPAAIQSWPTADYRYRIIFPTSAINDVFDVLSENIDYSNFKGRIMSLPDQREKMEAYHELWHAGVEWQAKDKS